MLRYASHVACLHVLSACASAQNPVSALNSNVSSLPPLQCDHFVTALEFANINAISLLVLLLELVTRATLLNSELLKCSNLMAS
jgi:hypothetical protein